MTLSGFQLARRLRPSFRTIALKDAPILLTSSSKRWIVQCQSPKLTSYNPPLEMSIYILIHVALLEHQRFPSSSS